MKNMMKKFLAIMIFAFACIAGNAQKPVGSITIYPRIGLNLSKYSGDEILSAVGSGEAYAHAQFKTGLTAGIEAQYQLSDIFAMSGGIIYSRQGTAFEHTADL